MSGWIIFPQRQKNERKMPVLFLPELQKKWSFMAEDIRNSGRTDGCSGSIGFYCGLLDGQSGTDHALLAEKTPDFPQGSYDDRFLVTEKVFDTALRISLRSIGKTGEYSVKNANSPVLLRVSGSVPVFPPFLIARQCLYFGFSPYILKK